MSTAHAIMVDVDTKEGTMFQLSFKTDNAAFDDPSTEIARILRKVTELVEDRVTTGGGIQDVNGNTIGSWAYDPFSEERQG